MRTLRSVLLTCTMVAAPWSPALAQDAQYWTYQFGTRATLLGGAVIGSVLDISATYYNPGALALIEDPELVATSRVFEISNISIDGTGEAQFDLCRPLRQLEAQK